MDDLLVKSLEDRGFVGFGVAEGGFAYLWSKRPVGRIDDLKGERMWTPEGDAIAGIFLETAGVSPIPLAIGDVSTALATRLIDAFAAPPTGAIAMQWHTRARYLLDIPLVYTYGVLIGVLIMERRSFFQLVPGDRAIIRDLLARTTADLGGRARADNESAKRVAVDNRIGLVAPAWREQVELKRIAARATGRIIGQNLLPGGPVKELSHARKLRELEEVKIPILVDDLAGTTHKAYGFLANMVYLIDREGVIVYKSNWTDAQELEGMCESLVRLNDMKAREVPIIRSAFSERLHWIPMDPEHRERIYRRSGEKAIEDFFKARGYDPYATDEERANAGASRSSPDGKGR